MVPTRRALAALLLACWASVPASAHAAPAAHAAPTASAAPPARGPAAASRAQFVSDGAAGGYIAWSDSPDGSQDVFLVRVTASGAVASGWPASGLTVCAAPGDQRVEAVLPDGANGVLVVWSDGREAVSRHDLYAQRVDTTGAARWAANGVRLATTDSYDSRVCADGIGGVIAIWDVGSGDAADIVGNRLTAAGANAAGWSVDGTPICGAAHSQSVLDVVGDGAGGGYFLWSDQRTGVSELYAQHLNSAGVAQWSADGITLAGEPFGIEPLAACEDGAGGVIAVWSGEEGRIAQRFNAAGAAQWTSGGVVVEAGSGTYQVRLMPTGGGGVLAVWDVFAGSDMELRAQRLNGTGAVQWAAEGVVLRSTAATGQLYDPACIADGLGGAIVRWIDGRGTPGDWWPTYAQRIDAAGVVQWPADGRRIAPAGAEADAFVPTPDGAGGAMFTWIDYGGYVAAVRAQRLDAAGAPQWGTDGLAVTAGASVTQLGGLTVHDGANGAWVVWVEVLAAGQQVRARHLGPTGAPLGAAVALSAVGAAGADHYLLGAEPDGAGGLIAGWSTYLAGDDDVHAQRVDATGTPLWTAGGLLVLGSGPYHYNPRMIADGSGGALFAWSVYGTSADVRAQRVTAGGALSWGAEGTLVCGVTGHQFLGALTSDGAGGAICVWSDWRDPAGRALYAQRLDAAGVAQWAANGVAMGPVRANDLSALAMVPDGANGAIVLIDAPYRLAPTDVGTVDSLRLQRVDATGATRWGALGTTVLALGTTVGQTRLVPDGLAGAIAVWEDERSLPRDLYAQRVDGTGAAQWTANGVALCAAPDWQELAGVAGDGAGGVFASWADARGHADYDLYAQHLLANGSPAWTPDGLVVSGVARGQYGGGLALDATGGVIVGWTDNRAVTARSVLAQRVQANGSVRWTADGVTSVQVSLASATLAAGRARLAWQVSTEARVRIERATEGSAWAAVAERLPDGDGRVHFEDASVRDGIRYGYRLAVPDDGTEVIAGEVWLGSRFELALAAPSPNPAPRDFALAFVLPVAAPARLELFDVRGRRVASRDVGALGAGRHRARFDGHHEPGVYFARLTQGAATRHARVVIVE